MDPISRAKVDEKREDAKLRRMAESAAKQLRRDQEWVAVRGGEMPPEPSKPSIVPLVRESWMTDLPPERMPKPLSQVKNSDAVMPFHTGSTQLSLSWTQNSGFISQPGALIAVYY